MHSAFTTTGHLLTCLEKCVCRAIFTTEHALTCSPSLGTMKCATSQPTIIFTELRHDVCVEPRLQRLSGEALSTLSAATENNARLDVAGSI